MVWRVLLTQAIRRHVRFLSLSTSAESISRGQVKHFHEFLRDQMPNMRIDMYNIFVKTLPPMKREILSPLSDMDAIVHAKHHYVRTFLPNHDTFIMNKVRLESQKYARRNPSSIERLICR